VSADRIAWYVYRTPAPGANARLNASPIPLPEGYIRVVAPMAPATGAPPHGGLYVDLIAQHGRVTNDLQLRQKLWSGYYTANRGTSVNSIAPSSAPNLFIEEADSVYARMVQGSVASGDVRFAIGMSDKPGPGIWIHHEPAGPAAGDGFIRTVTGTNPAAGTQVSETVPTNVMWKLHSFSVVLATAVGSSIEPALVIDDGTGANRRYGARLGATQGASVTRTHLYVLEAGNQIPDASRAFTMTDTDTVIVSQCPGAGYLPEGYRIRTAVVGGSLAAGDDYAAPIFQVEEWAVP